MDTPELSAHEPRLAPQAASAGLVQGADGSFYGTTADGVGTVFKITPAGTLTTLNQSLEGSWAGLVQGSDGNFYGTTAGSGNCTSSCGTIFEITAGGALTTLHSFDGTNGSSPYGGLVQATNGTFYGTTDLGGTSNDGVVFSLSLGFGPFGETQTTSGKVRAHVIVLGNNLTGATSVSFNGSPTTFTVIKSSEIKTNVPDGATTGPVTVTTPSGTLNSNVAFRVTPQIKSFTPKSGPVGTPVQITGVSLTQTTGVTFGGVAQTTFTVNSDTQVSAAVPTGARTGKIVITTAGGTATSIASFRVTR